MLKSLTSLTTTTFVIAGLSMAGAFAQPDSKQPADTGKVSKSNEGKGTTGEADPSTSTPQEVAEGAMNLDGHVSAPADPAMDRPANAHFDDIDKPQQDTATNKGKGTGYIDEFEADRDHQYGREAQYTDSDKMERGDVGDKMIRSRTNQGKGTGEGRGSWYDPEREQHLNTDHPYAQ